MKHTPGAMKAAEIIMGDKHKIRTDYGEKTIYGIADLIEIESGAQELLEVLKEARAFIDSLPDSYPGPLLDRIDAAIAKAEG